MNRFLPQVSRFLALQKSMHNLTSETPSLEPFVVRTPSDYSGAPAECRVCPGQPAILYCHSGVTRYNVQEVLDTIYAKSVSPLLRPAFLIDSAILEDCQAQELDDQHWLFVDCGSVSSLTQEKWHEYLTQWNKKIVFIHRRDLSILKDLPIDVSPEAPVIVMANPNSIIWLGLHKEFVKRQKELVAPYLASASHSESDPDGLDFENFEDSAE